MPFILRTIRKSRWYDSETLPWLPEGDIQADPLGDLVTKGNQLSVWLVDDDRSNLEQILTALAATRDHAANLDYLLFDLQILSETRIRIRQSMGGTPDKEVNDSHRDLVEVSSLRLVELVKRVLANDHEKGRRLEKELLKLVGQAVLSGRVKLEELKPGLKAKVEAQIKSQGSPPQ